jgi:threonyl-tRNA synthetase
MERFLGVLIEHYAGAFPVWLSPDQVSVIPITDAHNEYAARLTRRLVGEGIRAKFESSSDRMHAKIRKAQLLKIPYMLVIGEREVAEGTVSLRKRDGTRADDMPVDEFIALVKERNDTYSSEL